MQTSARWRIKPHHNLTEAEFERVLEAAARNGGRDWMLLFMPANTGLRISEVIHLKVKDLEHDSGLQVIRRKKKTLEADTLAVAKELFQFARQYVKESAIDPRGWLFPGGAKPCWRHVAERVRDQKNGRLVTTGSRREKVCDGGHLTIRRAQAIWDRALAAAGLKVKGRGIHTLRHYDLTRFYKTTKDLRATQIRAGHSSPITTTAYADVVDMQEKADSMGVSMGKSPWAKAGKAPPKRGVRH